MARNMNKSKWSCGDCSRRGASHFRNGLPNQDAITFKTDPHTLVMAVSDGHGSPKNFRSEQGSQLAVQVAVDMLWRSYHSFREDGMLLSDIEQWLKQSLAKRLVESWQSAVDAHWQANPFTEGEWTRLLNGNSHGARKAIESNPILAYGATLLAVLVTEKFVFCLQLGDGDILSVSVTGETTRPIPSDERLIANETTSLCMKNAWEECRVEIVEYELEDFPALILLSTDGYSNSFTSDTDFLKIGSDYLNMIEESGLNQVIEQLPSFLDYASQNGSGDDITLGIIYQNQQDNQIHIDLEETPLQLQKVAKRKVKKNRNSGRSNLIKVISFVGILLLLGFIIAFIATLFKKGEMVSDTTNPTNGVSNTKITSSQNPPASPSQNCSNADNKKPIKLTEPIKIDVVIKEIGKAGFSKSSCIDLRLEFSAEDATFFFLMNTQLSSKFQEKEKEKDKEKDFDAKFSEHVKKQTGFTELPTTEPPPGTTSSQSYFYFTAKSQSSKPLKGYSYFNTEKGWIVTLICPADSFNLCQKKFVDEEINNKNNIRPEFKVELDKLSKSNKPVEKSTNLQN